MESSDSSEAQKSSEDKSARSSLNDALLANQSQSTSSSENVQSMIIRVLDDIVGRVSDNAEDQRLPKKLDKKVEKKSKRKRNVKKSQQKEENSTQKAKDEEVKSDQQEAGPVLDDQTRSAQIDDQRPAKPESVSIQLAEVGRSGVDQITLLDDQYIDDEELMNRQSTASPEQYGSLLDYFRDPNYWQQSAVIETDHNSVPVCEKLIVQSMPNMTTNPSGLKLNQQVNPGLLSVLASRSPSQVDISEVEKQACSAFSDYGHCNELLCKIHARSRIARQLRKKSRRESKQFTLPSGYKVAYTSTSAQNRSYKFNKSKHHYQPPVQFQRSLSCSVAVLNSLSVPAKKHSKRRDSTDSAKKPVFGSHKRPKLNFHQILTLIVLASLAFASQCSMVRSTHQLIYKLKFCFIINFY